MDARAQMRSLVSRRVAEEGLTLVLVTHDVLDLTSLASDVVVLEEGRVAERGPVARVLAAPASGFAAQLTGTAVLAGTLDGDAQAPALVLDGGLRLVGRPQEHWEGVAGADGVALVPPDAVGLYPRDPGPGGVVPPSAAAVPVSDGGGCVSGDLAASSAPASAEPASSEPASSSLPSGSPRNRLPVRVTGLERAGALVTVRLALAGPDHCEPSEPGEQNAGSAGGIGRADSADSRAGSAGGRAGSAGSDRRGTAVSVSGDDGTLGGAQGSAAGGAVLSAAVTAGAVADLGIEVGACLSAVVKAVQVQVLPASWRGAAAPGPSTGTH